MGKTLKQKLLSRKFAVALVGAAITALSAAGIIHPDQVEKISAIAVTGIWFIWQAWEDSKG